MVRMTWIVAVRLAAVMASVWMLCSITYAQTPQFEIRVSKTVVALPSSLPSIGGEITVYMTNKVDSVAAFTLFVQLNRPDIISFVAADSTHYQYDLSGSAVENWGSANVRSLSGTPYDVRIDASVQPMHPVYLAPCDTARVLVKLPFLVLPPAKTDPDPSTEIFVSQFPALFVFSRPNGTSIGWYGPEPTLDTTVVSIKSGSVRITTCVADFDVTGDGLPLTVGDVVELTRIMNGSVPPPANLSHADLNGDCVINSADSALAACFLEHGMSCLPGYPLPTCCSPQFTPCCVGHTGNVDCDPQGQVDISDLSAMIDHLYISLSPPCCYSAMNIDGDPQGAIDISDLSALIDYLYISFTPPAACLW